MLWSQKHTATVKHAYCGSSSSRLNLCVYANIYTAFGPTQEFASRDGAPLLRSRRQAPPGARGLRPLGLRAPAPGGAPLGVDREGPALFHLASTRSKSGDWDAQRGS